MNPITETINNLFDYMINRIKLSKQGIPTTMLVIHRLINHISNKMLKSHITSTCKDHPRVKRSQILLHLIILRAQAKYLHRIEQELKQDLHKIDNQIKGHID